MLVLSLNQASASNLQEMLGEFYFEKEELFKDWYGVLCAFAGLSLLPFAMEFVEDVYKRQELGGDSGYGCTAHLQPWKWPHAQDKQGIQDHIGHKAHQIGLKWRLGISLGCEKPCKCKI